MLGDLPDPIQSLLSLRCHRSGMGVENPGRDTIHLESSWGGQNDNIGPVPPWLQGLALVSADQDSITRLETVGFRERVG